MEFLTLAQHLVELARNQNIRLTIAESCTGGLLAGAITEVPGSSDVFECGFVTYSNAAKIKLLGVQATSLAQFGAVSEEVAGEMATGALARSGADLAISVTGIAGPGGSDNKPEGRVCFALASAGQATISETKEFTALGRSHVRAASVRHALNLLIGAIG